MPNGMDAVPSPAVPAHHRRTWRTVTITLAAAYLALTLLVVVGSPLDQVDLFFYHLDLTHRPSSAWSSVNDFVQIGDGVPVSVIAALYAIRRCWTTRSLTPWVKFGIVLFLLNASVGAMKHLTGRLGPSESDIVHTVWAGGTIFPSGHAANATVMFGLMAVIAPAVHRRMMTRLAVTMAVLIGLGTVVLNTHWVSDVLGGWMAGALVLLVLPVLTPPVDRLVSRVARRLAPIAFDWSVALLLPPLPRDGAGRAGSAGPAAESASTPVGTSPAGMAAGTAVLQEAPPDDPPTSGSAARRHLVAVHDHHRPAGYERRHQLDAGLPTHTGDRHAMPGGRPRHTGAPDTRGRTGGSRVA